MNTKNRIIFFSLAAVCISLVALFAFNMGLELGAPQPHSMRTSVSVSVHRCSSPSDNDWRFIGNYSQNIVDQFVLTAEKNNIPYKVGVPFALYEFSDSSDTTQYQSVDIQSGQLELFWNKYCDNYPASVLCKR